MATIELSRYEGVATAVLKQFPHGTTMYTDEVLQWAEEHKNGLAADLAIPDPKKRVNSIIRHINQGGASRNLGEAKRFVIKTIDPKHGRLEVVAFADHGISEAAAAFGKCVRGALRPPQRAQEILESIIQEDLDEDKRAEVEAALKANGDTLKPLKKMLGEQIVSRYVALLVAETGVSPEQARAMLDVMPSLNAWQKLLVYTH